MLIIKTQKVKMIVRRNSKILILCLLFLVSSNSLFSQKLEELLPDSSSFLSLDEFIGEVLKNNPIAQQANIVPSIAKQELRMARGNFDPKAIADYDNKVFKNSEYFGNWSSYLSIPTWYGIEVKAGFDRNIGANVNPYDFTPNSGLSYAGLSVPILQGLIIDERRANLKVAQLMLQMSQNDRTLLLNNLLFYAIKDYYDYVVSYYNLYYSHLSYNLAYDRYYGIKKRVEFGDLAAIDTVEATIAIQKRRQTLRDAHVLFNNSRILLSNYLWDSNLNPVEIDFNTVPSVDAFDNLQFNADSLSAINLYVEQFNPYIRNLGLKGSMLAVEKRLAIEKLKPKLNANYNFLYESFFNNGNDLQPSNFLVNNYKAGINFSYPLFLRKERGKLGVTNLKIRENLLKIQQTNRDINVAINQNFNKVETFKIQIKEQDYLVKNTERLRDGELEKFKRGESSIFLINTREQSLISSLIKRVEYQAKLATSIYKIYYEAGNLTEKF